MKRTTISLTDDLWLALEREARRQRVSVAEVTRRALAEHLGIGPTARQLPFAALGGSGTSHTARDLEEILAEEWQADRGR